MPQREFKLPDLGEGLEDAEVVRWLVAEGDEVSLNQPIVEVDTAKALVEIPSPFAGKVTKLNAAEGDVVAVGAPLLTIEESGEDAGDGKKSVLVGYGVEERKPTRRRRLTAVRPASRSGTVAPPVVRRLAQEKGVDLSSLKGTGPGGRITREDVLNAVEAPTAPRGEAGPASSASGNEERIPVRGVRRVVAKRMTESATTIPHVTTFLSVDATEMLKAKDRAEHESGVKVTALAVLVRAFVEICRAHPKLNSSWDEAAGEIVLKRYYHAGIATDTERGLVVPVVSDAGDKRVGEIAEEISALTKAAREGTAKPEDLSGSTVTISNVGSFGAEYGTPIINPPEAAILAFGVIEARVVVVEGRVEVRPMVTLSLSFDHRIMDGAEAGRAMLDLKRLLEDAVRLKEL
jgi:pyruvate/2-oxoglutarate dehydrogenase complex dihydrolipoamide acyltransferase (E2) component